MSDPLAEGYAAKATVSTNGMISIPRRLLTEKKIRKGDVWKFYGQDEFLALPESVTEEYTILHVVVEKAGRK